MDSNALLRGGIQPEGLERAVSGKRDVERVVGAHESGDESRRRTVKDFLGRADLDDAPGVDDGDAVGQCQRFLPVVRHIHRSDSDSLLQCAEFVAQCPAMREKNAHAKQGRNPFEGRAHPRGMAGKPAWNKGRTLEECFDPATGERLRECSRQQAVRLHSQWDGLLTTALA